MNTKQARHDAAVLPRIHALKAEGRSLREIAEQLQQDGVPTARRGGQWNHSAVGRILDRAERTRPQEPSPPPPPPEQTAAQAEPPPTPAESPPAPAPPFQKIEEQLGNAEERLSARIQQSEEQLSARIQEREEQLSARIQEREEHLGNAVDQMGVRVQDKIETAESQVDERIDTLNWSFTRLWVRPVFLSLAICLGVLLAAWGFTKAVAYRIDSQRATLAELKSDIEEQQATLRELEQDTWGVGYREFENGRFLVLPEDSLRTWEVDGKPAVKLPDK